MINLILTSSLDLEILKEMFWQLLPLIIVQIGLMIYALVDLIKRDRVRFNNKLIWLLIIVFINFIGPIIYLIFKEDNK